MEPKTLAYREILLERLRVHSQQRLSPQLAHDAKFDVYADMMVNQIVVRLSSYVLAERLLRDDQSASFSETVVVEQDAPRHLVIPQAALVLLTTALGFALGSVAVIVLAGLIALVAVAAFAANPPQTHERTVSGTVTIPVTSYASFPENTMAYPDSLGPVVRTMQAESPYWDFDR